MHWKFKCFQYGDPLLFVRPPSPGRQAQISGDARQDLIRAARKCLDGKETSENTWKGGWLVWIFQAKLLFSYHFSCLKFCLFLMWSDSNMIPFWQDVCDRILWHIFTECWGLDGKWKALRCLGSTTLHSSCKLRGYRVTSDMSMQPFATHRYNFRR